MAQWLAPMSGRQGFFSGGHVTSTTIALSSWITNLQKGKAKVLPYLEAWVCRKKPENKSKQPIRARKQSLHEICAAFDDRNYFNNAAISGKLLTGRYKWINSKIIEIITKIPIKLSKPCSPFRTMYDDYVRLCKDS
jgi:hypothetical protein